MALKRETEVKNSDTFRAAIAYDANSGFAHTLENIEGKAFVSNALEKACVLATNGGRSGYGVAVLSRHNDKMQIWRTWSVNGSKEQTALVKELVANKGVTDSEKLRFILATNNSTHSIVTDPQDKKFYGAEDDLENSGFKNPMLLSRNVSAEQVNSWSNFSKDDYGHAMALEDAERLTKQVLRDYGVSNVAVKMMERALDNVVAFARLETDKEQFCNTSKMTVQFNPKLNVRRGVVLHELAHVLDRRLFGSFSHGPAFVLTFCELMACYTKLGFAETFAHFKKAGVAIANPIASHCFSELTKAQQKQFKEQYRSWVEGE